MANEVSKRIKQENLKRELALGGAAGTLQGFAKTSKLGALLGLGLTVRNIAKAEGVGDFFKRTGVTLGGAFLGQGAVLGGRLAFSSKSRSAFGKIVKDTSGEFKKIKRKKLAKSVSLAKGKVIFRRIRGRLVPIRVVK